jgi:hypothetical protein
LNSTLWLRSLDALTINNGMPTSQSIYYGMLIDADSNNNTGFQGIDYQVEVNGAIKPIHGPEQLTSFLLGDIPETFLL